MINDFCRFMLWELAAGFVQSQKQQDTYWINCANKDVDLMIIVKIKGTRQSQAGYQETAPLLEVQYVCFTA